MPQHLQTVFPVQAYQCILVYHCCRRTKIYLRLYDLVYFLWMIFMLLPKDKGKRVDGFHTSFFSVYVHTLLFWSLSYIIYNFASKTIIFSRIHFKTSSNIIQISYSQNIYCIRASANLILKHFPRTMTLPFILYAYVIRYR